MKHSVLFFLLLPLTLFSQKTAIVKGVVVNEFNNPIENVAITYLDQGTTTNKKGEYQFTIPLLKTVKVTFTHLSYKTITQKFTARSTRTFNFNAVLLVKNKELKEILIKNQEKEAQGITKIDVKKAVNLIGANAGVENVLMTLPGVNNTNELSTQYNVRGGNFDENLVYVNGIEVYRPFLIRSGQQEGLSFINPHLIQNINFSAGGFQSKYGDKLSSVLDITYRKPTEFKAQLDLSLLGISATVENQLFNNKLSAILGIRYRNNSLFVNHKQTEVNFKPRFVDLQAYLSYKFNKQFSLNFLANTSVNDYNYKPLTRRTRFGTLVNPLELVVFYKGQEKDTYRTLFGALSADFKVNENVKIISTVSNFNTQEQEYFDIAASYNLGEVNTSVGSENFGEVQFYNGVGSQLNHARNDLDALISNVQIRAVLKNGTNQWEAGVKYQNENNKDRIREWEMIDSIGFAIRPPNKNILNHQPYEPFTGPIEPFKNIRKTNQVVIDRLSGFVQFSRKTDWKNHQIWMNLGARAQRWVVTNNTLTTTPQLIFSPRAQFAIKPDWKKDMLFRISGGWYSQPPFYKELRDDNGHVNLAVKAQKSIHVVLGNDYSFSMWERPFKLTAEAYYKNLFDVNAYTVDNVRIRYKADNTSVAYAYGIDLRLNGEFVPGNDSWVSLGFLKTEENNNNRGYIARPTDQRIKLGILFQDYVPNLPDLKAHLNLVYNTGVPGGAPAYADSYQYQNRLKDYSRADVGISYIFKDASKQSTINFFNSFKEFTLGLEIFNLFDMQNAITNTWVRDSYSKRQYGIPNYMTGRVLNCKISMKF
ncbi:carboxypeptidase regulatory-like domain-containing protein [Tenacibaculum sp. UWU-22]|uniref:TonB-dependent receptor n=1 Tax=Tenacibaculum sp. UWU-22 TaxID=3234187 RepID=UPI0034DB1C97